MVSVDRSVRTLMSSDAEHLLVSSLAAKGGHLYAVCADIRPLKKSGYLLPYF